MLRSCRGSTSEQTYLRSLPAREGAPTQVVRCAWVGWSRGAVASAACAHLVGVTCSFGERGTLAQAISCGLSVAQYRPSVFVAVSRRFNRSLVPAVNNAVKRAFCNHEEGVG